MRNLKVNDIYCLSLERGFRRRAQLMENFPRIGEKIQFIQGIDGSQPNLNVPSWVDDIKPHDNYSDSIRQQIPVLNYNISQKEKACVLGHMTIWKMIAESNRTTPSLILEDDIIPHNEPEFIRNVNSIIGEMHKDEIVYLGYRSFASPKEPLAYVYAQRTWHWLKHQRLSGSLNSIVKYNLVLKKSPRHSHSRRHLHHAGQHWGAFCYLINSHSAQQLLALNAHLKMTSDGTLRYANLTSSIPIFISKKSIVEVDEDLGSNIRSEKEHASNFKLYKSNGPGKGLKNL